MNETRISSDTVNWTPHKNCAPSPFHRHTFSLPSLLPPITTASPTLTAATVIPTRLTSPPQCPSLVSSLVLLPIVGSDAAVTVVFDSQTKAPCHYLAPSLTYSHTHIHTLIHTHTQIHIHRHTYTHIFFYYSSSLQTDRQTFWWYIRNTLHTLAYSQ